MNTEKTLALISSRLNINDKESEKLFNDYWEFIEKELIKKGSVKIPGFGSFSIVFDKKENNYKTEFSPDEELIIKVYGEDNGK
ncbi:MAG TPA: HU family DNA-binding protein [Spirochaetota bacterium]|nr:HU family DNA-binding protein [Spirochaetota bacterium]